MSALITTILALGNSVVSLISTKRKQRNEADTTIQTEPAKGIEISLPRVMNVTAGATILPLIIQQAEKHGFTDNILIAFAVYSLFSVGMEAVKALQESDKQ